MLCRRLVPPTATLLALACAAGAWAPVARAATVVSSQRSGEGAGRAAAESPGAAFARLRQHAESLAAQGRSAEAVVAFQAARRLAPTAEDEARIWFRIGGEHSRLGNLPLALDAYARQLATGEADATALANSAELLMALGRLEESIAAYREALEIEERAKDRRGHLTGLALGYLGLGVALDRSGRADAAREAIGRAVALDPGLGVLRLAEQGAGEVFLIPAEDVTYYMALAREVQGRPADALVAFRSYLDAAAKRRAGQAVSLAYVERARAHVAALAAGPAPAARRPPQATPPRPAHGLRVAREATLSAEGPLVAPLIDAAWRLDPRLLDACLAEVPVAAAGEVRVSLDVTFDGGGRVRRVAVEPADALPDGVASCIETALTTRLRPPRPARKKATRARIELVLAPAAPSGV